VLNPAGELPTPLPAGSRPVVPTATREIETATPVPAFTSTPTQQATPTGLPVAMLLPDPPYEAQGINNCGPASLSMAMHMLGWQGDQYDIAAVVKPVPQDRNVNPEELAYYVRNYAGWMNVQYRVNGSLPLLKVLIAEGFPVIVEEAYRSEISYYPNDDLWTAHYLLLTGYDDAAGAFTAQDSYYGENRRITYERLLPAWEPFNYLYLVLYLPDREARLQQILGVDWDEDANRQNALAASQQSTLDQPDNAFAWFNYGNNLVYFERYEEAATAFDQARSLGLPQRMLRYQFTPFLAYFHSLRTDDLLAISKYALGITRDGPTRPSPCGRRPCARTPVTRMRNMQSALRSTTPENNSDIFCGIIRETRPFPGTFSHEILPYTGAAPALHRFCLRDVHPAHPHPRAGYRYTGDTRPHPGSANPHNDGDSVPDGIPCGDGHPDSAPDGDRPAAQPRLPRQPDHHRTRAHARCGLPPLLCILPV
jgi:tetratricopeptide (TPR) repeat protein